MASMKFVHLYSSESLHHVLHCSSKCKPFPGKPHLKAGYIRSIFVPILGHRLCKPFRHSRNYSFFLCSTVVVRAREKKGGV